MPVAVLVPASCIGTGGRSHPTSLPCRSRSPLSQSPDRERSPTAPAVPIHARGAGRAAGTPEVKLEHTKRSALRRWGAQPAWARRGRHGPPRTRRSMLSGPADNGFARMRAARRRVAWATVQPGSRKIGPRMGPWKRAPSHTGKAPAKEKARKRGPFMRGERRDSNPRPPGPQPERGGSRTLELPVFIGETVIGVMAVSLKLMPRLMPREPKASSTRARSWALGA